MRDVDEEIRGHPHAPGPHASMGEAEFVRHVQWTSGEWLSDEVSAARRADCADCHRDGDVVEPEVDPVF